ncbi:Retrovirus-related Pol polyprotein from type-2 retrotransposable element R2DM [Amphibalanus amphitrite]|uniref:Retrovirus-related Pol polyprotein from type-2 retrotransposable element R2DM n=1 Tax=Amphibalanus amphitrite TaxID=1232801 RepID=A0A6A4VLN7_AMPAM|nr:Retrovirus-related Pol polyprotein from type-2 retrotransposable element R2DM [Amphibalanus amphitrite]
MRGLGVHIASKHRAQRDLAVSEKRDANLKKARWDPEERRLLAVWEARYTPRGSTFTNADLREKLPHRSLEAIIGQRRKEEHKTLVQDLLRDPPPSPISAPPTNPEPPDDDPESEPAPPPPGPDPATLAWRRPIIRLLSSLSRPNDIEEKNWRADLVAQALAKINQEDPEDPSGDDAAYTILQEHAEAILPPGRPHRKGAREPPPAPRTARQKQREEFRMAQKLCHKDRKRCAQTVMAGHWKYDIMTAPPKVTPEAQEQFWGQLFSRESPVDDRPVDLIRDAQWRMVAPITEEELANTIKAMKTDSAAGPDKITVRLLKSWPIRQLQMMYNLWMLLGKIPASLKHARTTLIPKTPEAAEPAKFRPITVSSVVVRAYTKLLARRAAHMCPLSPVQRAFVVADGTAENTTLLETIIQTAVLQRQPLSIAWLDV